MPPRKSTPKPVSLVAHNVRALNNRLRQFVEVLDYFVELDDDPVPQGVHEKLQELTRAVIKTLQYSSKYEK